MESFWKSAAAVIADYCFRVTAFWNPSAIFRYRGATRVLPLIWAIRGQEVMGSGVTTISRRKLTGATARHTWQHWPERRLHSIITTPHQRNPTSPAVPPEVVRRCKRHSVFHGILTASLPAVRQ